MEGIRLREGLALTDQTASHVVPPGFGPFQKGAGAIEGVVLEKENIHEKGGGPYNA